MELPEPVTLAVTDVKPYETNPRQISEEAVEAVRESIDEYGYVQEIVVDQDNVIVVGHTRFRALQALGVEEVQVYKPPLTPEQARRYRLIDNRTHELSDWAHDSLVAELREWESGLLERYFPDVNLEVGQAQNIDVTEKDIEAGEAKAKKITEAPRSPMTEVVCPACHDTFNVKTTTLPGLSPADIDNLLSEW